MDGHDGLSVDAHKSSKFYGQEKGEVLTRKVCGKKEEMVHRNGLHHSIPNSLPVKRRELLVELSMVEKEIKLLESQIKEVEAEAQNSKRAHDQSNSNKWQHLESSPPFEMKALHFICKAIRGDYKLSDFRTNHKTINSNTKEKRVTFCQKSIRQRPQTPRKNRSIEISRHKVLSIPSHSFEENQKWSANKLSENLMKCLIFIFMRILRTSSKSTESSTMFQKEDPYVIFDSKESIARDIGPYKNLTTFTSTSLDFNCIHNSAFLPLFQRLKILIDGLQKVELRFLSHQHKLAFWINMHNACIMHGYLQFGVPSVCSPDKIPMLMKQATLNIAGNSINAQTIQRFILRKTSHSVDKQIKGTMIQQLYGLTTPDPNITFALCYGTRSSPQVKIYTAEGVTSELERSKVEYLEAAVMVKTTKRIALPELLLRNMDDFGQDICPLMEWLCRQLPPSSSLRKSILECFRHGGNISTAVEIIPYDFEFQYLFAT